MAQNNGSMDVLVHRVANFPVPAAVILQATQAYQKTKEYNGLVASALNLAEGTLFWGYSKAEPIRKALDGPLESVSSFAVKKLDTIENSYPVVRKSPEELLEEYKRLSESNKLVKTVDLARLAALYGLEKIYHTTKYASDVVGGVKATGESTAQSVLHKGLVTVNGVFDISENIIDNYVLPADMRHQTNGIVDGYDKMDIGTLNRASRIAGKLSTGLQSRAVQGYSFTKEQAAESLKKLQATVYLLEHAKQISEWAQKNQTMNNAQQQALKLWSNIKEQAEAAKKDPEAVAVQVVQSLAAGSDAAFDRLLGMTRPCLPQSLLLPVAATSEFLHHLNESFSKANHLSQIKDEFIVHAREKLADVEDLLMRLVDFASTLPAARWVVQIGENHLPNGVTPQHSRENGNKN